MSVLNLENSILLIIDMQEKLLKAVFNKDIVSEKSEIISKAVSVLNIPVIVTEQYPKGLGSTIETVKKNLPEDTKYYEKIDFNALRDERLLSDLKTRSVTQIIVMGIETHICVHQTVQALLDNGFEVCVVKDACGSRKESEYYNGLEVIKHNGADIKTAEMVIFELLKSAGHPNFKEIQSLIK